MYAINLFNLDLDFDLDQDHDLDRVYKASGVTFGENKEIHFGEITIDNVNLVGGDRIAGEKPADIEIDKDHEDN